MVSAIGSGGSNIFLPSINFDNTAISSLQSVATTSTYTALSSVNGGFSEEGIAFLALVKLMEDDNKELNLAQRLMLLGFILGAQSDLATGMQALYSTTILGNNNAVLPVTGYDASGAALSGVTAAPTGTLYSAGV